jgi:hypothetical protein
MKLCPYGHDKDVVGVTVDRMCRACKRKVDLRYRKTVRGHMRNLATKRRLYLTNPGKFIAAVAKYQQANPEKVEVWKRKTKANSRGVNFWAREAKESL